MRSHVRSLLFVGVLLLVAAVAGLIGLVFTAFGGVSVAVSGASVTITNRGLPLRQAHISISDGRSTIALPVVDLPRGSTTIALPSPVKAYSGSTIDGERLGVGLTMYFSGALATAGSPVSEAGGRAVRTSSEDKTKGAGAGGTAGATAPPAQPGPTLREATAPEPK